MNESDFEKNNVEINLEDKQNYITRTIKDNSFNEINLDDFAFKLNFKKDDVGVYLEDKYNYMLRTIGDTYFNGVKFDDFIDKKKFVEKIYNELDNYSDDSDYEFTYKLYSQKVLEYIKNIFDCHGIELNDLTSINGYILPDFNEEELDESITIQDTCEILEDDCYLSDDQIANNIHLGDIITYSNGMLPQIINEHDRIKAIEHKYLYENKEKEAYNAKVHRMNLEFVINVLQDYYLEDNSKEEIIRVFKHAINFYSTSNSDLIDENALEHFDDTVFTVDQLKKIVLELHEFVKQLITEIKTSYKFDNKIIHDRAIENIKQLQIYNNLNVKTLLADVEGLELDNSIDDTEVLERFNDDDSPKTNDMDVLHSHKL